MTAEPPKHDAKIVAFKKRPPVTPGAAAKNDGRADRSRVRGNVAALVLAAVLVLVGWLLVNQLNKSSKIGDCLMAGRSNCTPVDGR